jgi:cold shock CspA family protein
VQGTIKHYDAATKSGSLLTDDRAEITIDDRSIDDPSVRFLRIGQRVRFEVGSGGEHPVARGLSLVTF